MKRFFKQFCAGISLLTLVVSPVAEGAKAQRSQKELVAQYLKATKLSTSKVTVRDYWRMVRHVYPQDLQVKMDRWVARNHDELMPDIKASSFKDASGVEQVKLTLSKDGQITTLTFVGQDEQFLKINGVSFSKNELNKFDDVIKKFYDNDKGFKKQFDANKPQSPLRPNVLLPYSEFAKLTPEQKIDYLISARQAALAAEKVLEQAQKTRQTSDLNSYELDYKSNFWALLLGDKALADSLAGKSCIVAGYISVYGGASQSCGGTSQGRVNLEAQMKKYQASCSSRADVPCNPLVYGFKSGKEAFCVPKGSVNQATAYCNKVSPLNNLSDKKRIIESFAERNGKNVSLKFDDEGYVSEEDFKEISEYLKGLNSLIKDATSLCDSDPEFAKIQKARKDQVSACDALKTRAIDLQTKAAKNGAGETPGGPGDAYGNCQVTKPGSNFDPDAKKCVCADGQVEQKDEKGVPFCIADIETQVPASGADTSGVDKASKEGPSWWDRNKSWAVPVGIGLLTFGLYWMMLEESRKSYAQVYTPPPTPPLPSTSQNPCNPGQTLVNGICTTPVATPPSNPCPAPNTLVNGICVPPEITPPPAPKPIGEGGSGTNTGTSGGVR